MSFCGNRRPACIGIGDTDLLCFLEKSVLLETDADEFGVDYMICLGGLCWGWERWRGGVMGGRWGDGREVWCERDTDDSGCILRPRGFDGGIGEA